MTVKGAVIGGKAGAPSIGGLAYADEHFQDKASALWHSPALCEPLHIGQQGIEQVSKFKYLASMQTSDLSARAEVSNSSASAANAWLKLCKLHVWDDDFISRGIECTLYKVIVQSMLLYASEIWALNTQQLHRLEVFRMKCLRKICKVTSKDKIRNKFILGWCNVARVSNIVSHRRLRWLGHLARMPDERLPKRVLSGHMDGSGVRGKSQKQWWSMSGKTCNLQGFQSHGGGNPRTGQAGGLP